MNTALGYETNPMRVGAPLPPEMTSISEALPTPKEALNELARAQVELMHAIARHRKAWAKMRRYRNAQDTQALERGLPEAYLDSDAVWGVIVGDVRWWRDEMAAQAAVVTALSNMTPGTGDLDGYAEATSFHELANGRRVFIKRS